MSSNQVLCFIQVLSKTRTPHDSSPTADLDSCRKLLWRVCGEWDSPKLNAFCSAFCAHPTAFDSLLAAVPTLSAASTAVEWCHAHRIVLGFQLITAHSTLVCDRLLQSGRVRRMLAACCRQCPWDLEGFPLRSFGLLFVIMYLLSFSKSRHRVRVVEDGLLAASMALFKVSIRVYWQNRVFTSIFFTPVFSNCSIHLIDYTNVSHFSGALVYRVREFPPKIRFPTFSRT